MRSKIDTRLDFKNLVFEGSFNQITRVPFIHCLSMNNEEMFLNPYNVTCMKFVFSKKMPMNTYNV